MRRTETGGMLLILCAAMLWGTTGTTNNLLAGAVNATAVGWLRLGIAAPGFMLFSWLITRAAFPRPTSRADRLKFLGNGLCAMAYQACFFQAVDLGGAGLAALVALCSAPLFVAGIAAAFLGERLTARTGTALAITLAGAGLLVGSKGSVGPEGSAGAFILAVGFALLSGLGYATFSVITKSLSSRYAGEQVNALTFSLGAIFLLPIALLGGRIGEVDVVGWGLLLYLGLGTTALAYIIYVRGLQTTLATTASILTLAEPLTATLLSAAIFYASGAPAFSKDQLTWPIAAGAGLMLIGLAVLSVGVSGEKVEKRGEAKEEGALAEG